MLKMFRLVKKYWSKNKTGHLCLIFNMLKWPVSLRQAKSCSTGEMGPLGTQLKCPHSSAGPQSALPFWVYFKLQLLATVLKASSNRWRVLKCYMCGLLLILPTLDTPTCCNQPAEEWARQPEGYLEVGSSANVTQIPNSKRKGKGKKMWIIWCGFLFWTEDL